VGACFPLLFLQGQWTGLFLGRISNVLVPLGEGDFPFFPIFESRPEKEETEGLQVDRGVSTSFLAADFTCSDAFFVPGFSS